MDRRDVAAVAVGALTTSGHEGKAYDLVTESLSHAEVAEHLSEATGRTITYENISPEVYEQTLQFVGYLKDGINTLQGLFLDVRKGINSDTNVSDTVDDVLGPAGIKFRKFALDYAISIGTGS